MVRRSKPGIVPAAILLLLFFGVLIGVHLTVDSEIGREIADAAILVAFFALIILWSNQK
jgi:hypothetical protein